MLPSVHRLKSIYELPDAIRSSLRKKVNANDVDKYLKLFDSHSFTFNIFEFDLDYHNQFFYGGNLLNVEISEDKVKQFIKIAYKLLILCFQVWFNLNFMFVYLLIIVEQI